MIVVPPQATDAIRVVTGRIGSTVGGGVVECCVKRCLGVDWSYYDVGVGRLESGDDVCELSVEDGYRGRFVRSPAGWKCNFLGCLLKGCVVYSRLAQIEEWEIESLRGTFKRRKFLAPYPYNLSNCELYVTMIFEIKAASSAVVLV
jgi:hypothetical protein